MARKVLVKKGGINPIAPVLVIPPFITPLSANAVGRILTMDPGTWTWTTGTLTYAYQWTRNGSPISGATTSTYLTVLADDGTDIGGSVTATAAGLSTTAVAANAVPVQYDLNGAQTVMLAAAGADGFAIDFNDNSMVVIDSTTPANNYNGDPFSKLAFTRASPAQAYNASGVEVTVGNNIPRHPDFDPQTLQLLGFLREDLKLNLLLYSDDLTQSAWTKTFMSSAYNQVSPTGVANTATRLTATAANATCLQTVTSASAQRDFWVNIRRVTGTGTVELTVDGGTTWRNVSAEINSVNFTRVKFSSGTLPAVTNPSYGFRLGTSGNAIDVHGCLGGSDSVELMASEVNTTTAQVTRAAETCTFATSLTPWAIGPGTLYFRGINGLLGDSGAGGNYVSGGAFVSIDSNSNNNGLGITIDSASSAVNKYSLRQNNNSGTASILSSGDNKAIPGALSACAVSWDGTTGGRLSVNGEGATISSSMTFPSSVALTTFRLNYRMGHYQQVAYFKRQMSAAELEALSFVNLVPETGLDVFQAEIDVIDSSKVLQSVVDPVNYGQFEFSYSGLSITGGSPLACEYGASELLDAMGFRWYAPTGDNFKKRPTTIPTNLTQAKTSFWMPTNNIQVPYPHSWAGSLVASRDLLVGALDIWAHLNAFGTNVYPAGARWPNIINQNQAYFAANPQLLKGGTGNYFDLTITGANYTNLVEICAAEILKQGLNYWHRTNFDTTDGDSQTSDQVFPFTKAVVDRVRSGTNAIGTHPARTGVADAQIGLYSYLEHKLPPTASITPGVYVQVSLGFNDTPLTYLELVQQFGIKADAVLLRGFWEEEAYSQGHPLTFMKAGQLDHYDGFVAGGARGITTDWAANWIYNCVWARYAMRKCKTGTYTYAQALDDAMANIFNNDAAVRAIYNLWSDLAEGYNKMNLRRSFDLVNAMVASWYKTYFQYIMVILAKDMYLPAQIPLAQQGGADPFPAAFTSLAANVVGIRDLDIFHSYGWLRTFANGVVYNNYRDLWMFQTPEPTYITSPTLPTVGELNSFYTTLLAETARDSRLDDTALSLITTMVPQAAFGAAATGFLNRGSAKYVFYGPGDAIVQLLKIVGVDTVADGPPTTTTYGAGVNRFTVPQTAQVTYTGGYLFLDTYTQAWRDPFGSGDNWLYVPNVSAGIVKLETEVRWRFYDPGQLDLFPTTNTAYVSPANLGPGQIRVDNLNTRGTVFNINCNRYLSLDPHVALIPTSIATEDGLIGGGPTAHSGAGAASGIGTALGVRGGTTATAGAASGTGTAAASSGGGVTGWQTAKVGAGGYVIGGDVHLDGTIVVRTDTNGAYLFSSKTSMTGGTWSQLCNSTSMASDCFPNWSQGAYEIRIAPSNSNIFYMMYQQYMWKTTNRGASWTKLTGFSRLVATDADPNDSAIYKRFGEKMAIDPNDPNKVIVGTAGSKCFYTTDGGTNWTQITTIAQSSVGSSGVRPGHQIIFIDSSNILIGCWGNKVYKTSGGVSGSWTLDSSAPAQIMHWQLASDGIVWICEDTAGANPIWKYASGSWTNLTTFTNSQGAIAVLVDPNNAANLRVIGGGGGSDYSTNRGVNWEGGITNQDSRTSDIPWLSLAYESYLESANGWIHPIHGRTIICQGIGVMDNTYPSARHVARNWTSAGIENLVARNIVPISTGGFLGTAWDRATFYKADPDNYGSSHGTKMTIPICAGWWASAAISSPTFIVCVSHWAGVDQSSYSTDSGQTWTDLPGIPASIGGGFYGQTIAVSTTQNFIWIPGGGGFTPQYTTNGGTNWNPCSFSDIAAGDGGWGGFSIVADGGVANKFYIHHATKGIYVSTNSGANFTPVSSNPEVNSPSGGLMTVPGQSGLLFFTCGTQAPSGPRSINESHTPAGRLWRSTNSGATWTSAAGDVTNNAEARSIGYGIHAPGYTYPAIYYHGWNGGLHGIWGSPDAADPAVSTPSWSRVGNVTYPTNNSLAGICAVMGDAVTYGKVYIGTGGGGFFQYKP